MPHRFLPRPTTSAVAVLAAGALAVTGLALVAPARAVTSDWVDLQGLWSGAGHDSASVLDDGGRSWIYRKGEDGKATVTQLRDGGGPETSYGTNGVSEAFPAADGGELRLYGGTALVFSRDLARGVATVRRLTTAGTIDHSFGTDGVVQVGFPGETGTAEFDLRPSDGTLVIASSSTERVGSAVVSTTRVSSFTESGAVETSFGTDGSVSLANSRLGALAAEEITGTVVVQDTDARNAGHLRRLTRTGATDSTWHGTGDLVLPADLSVTKVRSDSGVVYLTGSRRAADGSAQAFAGKLSSTGVWDNRFGGAGIGVAPRRACTPTGVDVIPTGAAVYVLDVPAGCGHGPVYLQKLGNDGRPEVSFGTGGTLRIETANGATAVRGGIQLRSDRAVLLTVDTVKGSYETGTRGVTTLLVHAAGTTQPGTFVPLTPTRVLDTRSGLGAPKRAVAANGTVTLQVGGRAGLPADVGAVVLNVTAVSPTAACAVTVYPSDEPLPTASDLNCAPGRTTANQVVVKVGDDGAVKLRNGSTGTTQLVADVAGYYRAGLFAVAGAYVPMTPTRLLDTRRTSGPVGPGRTVEVPVAAREGSAGIPSSAVAVVLNLTAASPTAAGVVTAYPTGTATPNASNLNFTRGQTLAGLATVKIGDDGKVTLKNGSAGTTQLIADVAGYYTGGTPSYGGTFVALPPTRVLDSRTGVGVVKGPRAAGTAVRLPLAGRAGVPATRVAAVVLTTTVTQPTGNGVLTAFPDDDLPPTASNLNFGPGQTVANLVTVRTGPGAAVDLGLSGTGTTQVIADIAGYFLD